MKLASIEWLYLLWIVPLLGVASFFIYKYKLKALYAIAPTHLLTKIVRPFAPQYLAWRMVLLVLSTLFIMLALLRPQWGYYWEETQHSGVDIIIAVDVSDSMLAEDVSPNRLARAKRKIVDLLRILEGDRVGLVVFAGTAFLQSPLTTDYNAIEMFLDYIDTSLIPVKGTSIGDAIKVAMRAFAVSNSQTRTMLLLTDGEDLEYSSLRAAEEAKKQDIRIYSIGIGSEKGAPIPNSVGGDFRKNAQGEMVFSKLDAPMLTKLAEMTNGYFVRSVSGDDDLIKIYKQEIKRNNKNQDIKATRVKNFKERFQWPLFLAVLFLSIEIAIDVGIFKKKKSFNNINSVLAVLLFCVLIFPQVSHAGVLTSDRHQGEMQYKQGNYAEAIKKLENAAVDSPNNAEILFNLASAYYQAKDYKRAEEAWQRALQLANKKDGAKSKELFEANNLYNIGNALFRQQKLKEAAQAYREALRKNAADADAAKNLALVEKLLKEQEQQKQQQDKNKKDDKQGDEKKDQNQQEQNQADKKEEQKKSEEAQANATPTPSATQAAQQNPEEMSKEDAERLINSYNSNQKEIMKNIIKNQQQGKKAEVVNDW